ncbi:uncharacterized protein [Eurosta solidaginis]|uniref:uncharacterized protein isoform X2 n=1 Tax=Eurosta solidaginis TaxID=178769 RepID=UPI0035308FE2
MTTTTQPDINTNTAATTTNEVAGYTATVGRTIGNNPIRTGTDTVASGDVDNIVGSPLTSSNRNSNSHTNSSNNFYSNSSNSNSNIGNNGSTTATATTNNQRAMNESNKRKKLKSRTATVPSYGHGHSHNHSHGEGYTKDHLDAWLETCLKDATNTQLSSSSEFLDYNPTPPGTAGTSGERSVGANPQKFIQQQMQQRHQQNSQQQQQQRDHHPHQQHNPTYLSNNSLNNTNQQTQFPYSQQQQHSAQQSQQQFGSRIGPISLTGGYTGGGGSGPFSQGFQRNVPNYMKNSHYTNRFSMMFPHSSMGPAPGGYYQQSDGQDFASLPPLVNMMGGSSEMENNSTDVLDGSGSNPNISRGFRFSDPCLLNPSDNDSKVSGQNTPDRRNQIPTELENNKFFAALMEQINILHETNTKICRNLHETKGVYTPGLMTDVVREVKEAARVREDALLNRVKAMVEERQWTMNENNLRMLRDIEELKSQVHHLRADRKETNKRITHLEAENKYMRQMLTSLFNQRNTPDVIYENETLRTQRKSFPTAPHRRSQSMNLHYGTIHHQLPNVALTVDEPDERLHIVEGATPRAADMVTVSDGRAGVEMRHSFSSSDGGGSVGAGSGGGGLGGSAGVHKSDPTGIGICTVTPLPNGNANTAAMETNQQLMSPPNFALVSTPVEEDEVRQQRKKKGKKVPNFVDVGMSRNNENGVGVDGSDAKAESSVSTQELQEELQDAVAARKEADKRVIALENMVRTLRLDSSTTKTNLAINNITSYHPTASKLTNGTGSGCGSGTGPIVGGESFSLINRLIGDSSNINPCTSINLPQRLTTIVQPQQKQHRAQTIVSTSSIGYVAQSPTENRQCCAGPVTDL